MVEDYTSLAKARTDSTMDDLPAIAPLLGTEPFINVFDSSLASDHGRETSARWFLFHVDLIRLGASLNLFPLLLEMLRTKGPGPHLDSQLFLAPRAMLALASIYIKSQTYPLPSFLLLHTKSILAVKVPT